MPVRNEDWIVGLSARAALMWCDAIVIFDHASTDGTQDVLRDLSLEFPGRVEVFRTEEESWHEMAHRDIMLTQAREMGASHVAIVDADEILTGNLLPSIRKHIEELEREHILSLPGYNLRGSLTRYHANGVWGNRWFSLAFADDAKLCWEGDQFHHRDPMGKSMFPWRPIDQGRGGIMHLWGASEERLRAKHAMYKVTERLRWPSKDVHFIEELYSLAIHGSPNPEYGRPNAWSYKRTADSWWAPYGHLMHHLHLYDQPWQGAEVRRLRDEHGSAMFAGLDLFGVAS